ncbi:MAG: hypothetical protein ABI281_00055 [Caldimonas sp.]
MAKGTLTLRMAPPVRAAAEAHDDESAAPFDRAAAVADAAVARWQAVGQVLVPIIGRGGVDALHKRTLHLGSAARPWLAATVMAGADAGDHATLREALAAQSPADAEAAQDALLQHFRDLLASLIGASLSERLLAPALAAGTTAPAASKNLP